MGAARRVAACVCASGAACVPGCWCVSVSVGAWACAGIARLDFSHGPSTGVSACNVLLSKGWPRSQSLIKECSVRTDNDTCAHRRACVGAPSRDLDQKWVGRLRIAAVDGLVL